MFKRKSVPPLKCRPEPKRPTKPTCMSSLSDLGKATKRGVKKCPNCGFINGSRGFMCKNTFCGKIFRADKRKLQPDSVKIVTGTTRQIFSVRIKDLPDERGFVQLPILEEGQKNQLLKVALCFIESCQRLFDDSILKCHENEFQNPAAVICNHIEVALKSVSNASPLYFKHELINGLKVEDEVKKKLCLLAKSTDGPLVQRVSSNVFVIKCLVSPNFPLGYLHFKVISSKEGGDDFHCFACGCSDLVIINCNDNNKNVKCEHYYAAICAFASDDRFNYWCSNVIHSEFNEMYLPSFELNLVKMLEQENNQILQQANVEIKILAPDYVVNNQKVVQKKGLNERNKQTNAKLLQKPVLDFNLWLSSVTESINNSFTTPNIALTFFIPNSFFIALRNILSKSSAKTKLTTFSNEGGEKYVLESWHVTQFTDLCTVFNTNLIKLNIFNNDNLLAKKVPLVTIEWIDSVYKITKFGELKILINTEL